MSVTGGPSQPSLLLANAEALGASATWTGPAVHVESYRTLALEIIIDQTATLALRGSGQVEPPATPGLIKDARHGVTDSITAESITSGANGDTFLLNVEGLRWIRPYVVNTAGSAATLTVRATLE